MTMRMTLRIQEAVYACSSPGRRGSPAESDEEVILDGGYGATGL